MSIIGYIIITSPLDKHKNEKYYNYNRIFFKASSADIYATLDVINLTTSGITSATAADIMQVSYLI